MALYEYKCTDCGETAELLIFSDDTPTCPACGSTNLEKLMSTFAVSNPGGGGGTPSCGGGGGGGCSGGGCPYS
jgi:putative FmdB family regulatory protein